MKKLSKILQDTGLKFIQGSDDVAISGMTADSRQVKSGYIFFAIMGATVDGHKYINKAIENGAIAIVCSNKNVKVNSKITVFYTKDAHEAYAMASSNFFNRPSDKIKVVGVTGTNGKTTIASLLFNLFNSYGEKSGLLSTVKYVIADKELSATHTTPDAFKLQELLFEMCESSCKYCFMEVSSHALIQKRIHGIKFFGAVFSNITHDHLDYHGTFSEYIKAKKSFFDYLNIDAFALYNIDDTNGKIMVQNTKAKKSSYGLLKPADFKSKIIESHFSGLALLIDGIEAWFKLPGRFNAYNITAVYATAILCGLEKIKSLQELSKLSHVDGRFNILSSSNSVTGIIDYAHTPDALKNVLETIVDLNQHKGQVICVAGAGGDRDKAKRPLMGKIMAHFSDLVIITSDNPRTEDPDQIIEEIKKGIDLSKQKKVLCIRNREEAIKTACLMAKPEDIILLAGKGHESYQEINGEKNHFDDKEILMKYLNE